MYFEKYFMKLCICLNFMTFVFCYPTFKSDIPNGDHVTDPCQNGGLWAGVGHRNRGGKGTLNPFGEDWRLNQNWTSICRIDSDKDGRTNGQELGDPNCTWTKGSNVIVSRDNVTHPGICEPLDNPSCTEINRWLNCTRTDFRCNTDDQDIRKLELRLNNATVPAKVTSYACMVFDIPRDQPYDIISANPILGNRNVIHHMVMYGCSKKDLKVNSNQLVDDCFMPSDSGCQWMISAFGLWETAADAFCLPPDVGVRIGQDGYEYLMVQYHWTNYAMESGLTDSSGVEISYTPSLRTHNSGMLLFGQMQIFIPPNQPNVTISGGCQPFCSKHRLHGPINVIESFHHMHMHGFAQKIEVFRNNTKVATISDEKAFDYNNPKFYRHYENPIVVLAGDYIRTTCSYSSVGTNNTIYFGPGTSNEMCFGFIRYYPLENLPLNEGGCSEYGTVPLCKIHTPERYTVDGCDVKGVLTLHGVNTNNSILSDMMQYCQDKDKCTQKCLSVQMMMEKDPCFNNDIGMYVKYLLSFWRHWEGRKTLIALGKTKCSIPENGSSCLFDLRHVMVGVMLQILFALYVV